MKPSALEVWRYLRNERGWVTTWMIVRNCMTVTPSKRLSELYEVGLIEKRRDPDDPTQMNYRAKEAQ